MICFIESCSVVVQNMFVQQCCIMTVLLRGCSSNIVGNTLQRDLQNLQFSSRKGCHQEKKTVLLESWTQNFLTNDKSPFKNILKTRQVKLSQILWWTFASIKGNVCMRCLEVYVYYHQLTWSYVLSSKSQTNIFSMHFVL